MLQMHSETEQIAAVLHDTVEDSYLTLEDIENEGFSHEVVNALRCLTRNDGEPYAEFVSRAKTNPVARAVKRADIEDKMNLCRLGELGQRDLDRLRDYHEAWKTLEQEGTQQPGRYAS